jgi:2-C-methyl-D-erythritol 4-phosphate cytidylyltransferase
VERMGMPIHLIAGEDTNIKITTPLDLRIAELLLPI